MHRFDEHRRNRFGSFALDDAGGLLDTPLAVGDRIERTADAVRMRSGRMDETGQWEIEWPIAVWQSGQAGGGERHAVIGECPGKDFGLSGFASKLLPRSDDFQGGLVGFRTGIAEDGVLEARRRQPGQSFRQADGGLIGRIEE